MTTCVYFGWSGFHDATYVLKNNTAASATPAGPVLYVSMTDYDFNSGYQFNAFLIGDLKY